jgi:methylglutaconyl-CoA hydratase
VPGLHAYTDSGAAVLTLTDSAGGNTLTLALLEELQRAVDAAFADPEARVVVLRSDGADFCLGMDLASFAAAGGDEEAARFGSAAYGRLLWTLFSGPKPVVSVVRGRVKAGGVGLVAASDVVVAVPEARFQLSEVYVGMIPATVLPYLLGYRMPLQKARYLVVTAKELEASEAHRIGLVDELVPPEELERAARGVVRSVLRSSPEALRHTKEFTAALGDMDFQGRRRHARETLEALLTDERIGRGITAFGSGELPEWFGRFKPAGPVAAPPAAAPKEDERA